MTECPMLLVEHVRAVGEYLAQNAEQIVGVHAAAGISEFSIFCDFTCCVDGSRDIPTVEVSKGLIAKKTVDVSRLGGR